MKMSKIRNKIHECLDKLFEGDFKTKLLEKFYIYLELINIIENVDLQENEWVNYFEDNNVQRYLQKSRVFFNEWELYLESIMHSFIIQGIMPADIDPFFFEKVKNYYVGKYQSLVRSEIQIANINQLTKVCHIGIGGMPLSLMMLHKYSGKCSIVGIDYDLDAISSAQECIRTKAISEPDNYNLSTIILKQAEGAEFLYEDFDVVIFSASITNKERILNQIKNTTNNSLFLIDRQVLGLSHYIYESSSFDISEQMPLKSKQFGLLHTSCYSIHSIGN